MIALLSKNYKYARSIMLDQGMEVLRINEATLQGVMKVQGSEVPFVLVFSPEKLKGLQIDDYQILGRCDPALELGARARML